LRELPSSQTRSSSSAIMSAKLLVETAPPNPAAIR
jgi:hypothetical protein